MLFRSRSPQRTSTAFPSPPFPHRLPSLLSGSVSTVSTRTPNSKQRGRLEDCLRTYCRDRRHLSSASPGVVVPSLLRSLLERLRVVEDYRVLRIPLIALILIPSPLTQVPFLFRFGSRFQGRRKKKRQTTGGARVSPLVLTLFPARRMEGFALGRVVSGNPYTARKLELTESFYPTPSAGFDTRLLVLIGLTA